MKSYCAYNKNSNIREKSSSGGIFYELAKYVLEHNGVVFGAKFDENYIVHHEICRSVNDIKYFMGSKYVQSHIGNCFQLVKNNLCNARLVLFCGTPCQCVGLMNFLAEDYSNLICMDFFCHGVPSPKVWKKYLDLFTDINNINFRNKENGWLDFKLKIISKNKVDTVDRYSNPYMQAFLCNMSLRPSCYFCKYKILNRKTDFTVADYWGCHRLSPHMFDNQGISILLLHSDKADKIWKCLCDKFVYEEITKEMIIASNPMVLKSEHKPLLRVLYFKIIHSKGILKATKLVNINSEIKRYCSYVKSRLKVYEK